MGAMIGAGSALWSTASWLARTSARMGLSRVERLGSRVISVGNIQVGGAGKTPLVSLIARQAEERKLKVAILSRGYGSKWERQGGLMVPGGKRPAAEECGDEVALLHELAPKAWMGIGADRVAQFRKLREAAGVDFDLVILDDGFQHHAIHKDLEIVAVTSVKRDQMLYRDWPSALKRADLVVWTKGEERPETFGKPLAKVHYRLQQGNSGMGVCLVTGVGDPASTLASVKAAGWNVVQHESFRDHAQYTVGAARELIGEAAMKGLVVAITGKDWMKWRDLGIREDEVIVLEPEIVFEQGQDEWNRLLWG